MRQESLFEPFAQSIASASGLMQVMPATGAEINRELNWPAGYDTADLRKPFVSVRFGAHYLAKQRRAFGTNMPVILAAYNGGPGNALRWRERGGDDPDTFTAAVTFEETRRYITAITINMAQYERLYRP
jgi:soluble lytic murein transglycosylase